MSRGPNPRGIYKLPNGGIHVNNRAMARRILTNLMRYNKDPENCQFQVLTDVQYEALRCVLMTNNIGLGLKSTARNSSTDDVDTGYPLEEPTEP